jgi:hypothetical protein
MKITSASPARHAPPVAEATGADAVRLGYTSGPAPQHVTPHGCFCIVLVPLVKQMLLIQQILSG